MIDWIKSWSMQTWAFAWALLAWSLIILVMLFGADTVKAWIAAVWGSAT